MIFDKDKIEKRYDENAKDIDDAALKKAHDLIKKYITKRRFVDMLKGHIIFGILRLLIFNSIKKEKGKRPNIDNAGLLMMLSNEVWQTKATIDHSSLSRRLINAIKEVKKQRQL